MNARGRHEWAPGPAGTFLPAIPTELFKFGTWPLPWTFPRLQRTKKSVSCLSPGLAARTPLLSLMMGLNSQWNTDLLSRNYSIYSTSATWLFHPIVRHPAARALRLRLPTFWAKCCWEVQILAWPALPLSLLCTPNAKGTTTRALSGEGAFFWRRRRD